MTRRERLMATLRGEPVDRPPVSFYEIGGRKMAPNDDEFTVWNDPSWRPLVQLADEKTDLIRFVRPCWQNASPNGLDELTRTETWREGNSRLTRTVIEAPGGRALSALSRRDKDTQTTWQLEHLLKDEEDVRAYLLLPEPTPGDVDVSGILAEEGDLGDSGIVSIEMADPICHAASLFSMEDYTVTAMMQPDLFHGLLQRFERLILPRCEQTARAAPGRLWRICGSEYASEPYLPPRLYGEYVVRYTGKMVKAIQAHGGYARIHSHGRLRGILPLIARMAPDGLDPVEPAPQGDMALWEVRQQIGRATVLMGNIEASDIENLGPADFERKVESALSEGTAGEGRGFVLMPSACPYGRTISRDVLGNYETMVRLAEEHDDVRS